MVLVVESKWFARVRLRLLQDLTQALFSIRKRLALRWCLVFWIDTLVSATYGPVNFWIGLASR